MPSASPLPEIDPILRFLAGTPELEVGAWRVVPRSLRLARDDEEERLEPRVMALLVVLARNAGTAVTRNELLDTVWSDVIVGDDALNSAVSKLRRALNGGSASETYIETIPKVGYRLVASVDWKAGGQPDATESDELRRAEGVPSRVDRRKRWPRLLVAAGAVAVAVTAGAVWVVSSNVAPPAPDPSSSGARPVTTFPGLEVDPALAPGGTADRVAFAWRGESGENWDIYVVVPGAGDPLRLTEHPGSDHHPAWSPDGRHLAFLRYDGGECSIHRVGALGGDERRIADCGGHAESLTWASDGDRLVYALRPAPDEPFRIVALRLDDLERRELTTPPDGSVGDLKAALSPDGSTLAFIRSPILGVEDIHLMDADGGGRRLTADNLKIHGFDWTPDGRHLVFSSNRGGLFSLWRIPVGGGDPAWLGVSGGDLNAPSVGEGGRIAYEQWKDETNIYHIDLEGREARPVVTSTRWDWHPAVSPDGERLAFVSDRSGSAEVWVTGIDRGTPRQRTEFGGPYVTAPRWDPSGERLAFEARADGNADIYVLASEDLQPRRLTAAAARDTVPTWSRDGEWVYFASDRSGSWQIWKVLAAGGEPVRITRNGGFLAQETTDGRWLLYSKHGAPGIHRMPVEGGPVERLIDDLDPIDRHQWTVTGTAIYSLYRPVFDRPVLVRYDLSGDDRREIGPVGELSYNSGLEVGPDDEFAFVTRVDRWESDILLVDLPD